MGCVLRAPQVLSALLAASQWLPTAALLSKLRPHPQETEAWKIPVTYPRPQAKQQRRVLHQSAGKVLCQWLDARSLADMPVE